MIDRERKEYLAAQKKYLAHLKGTCLTKDSIALPILLKRGYYFVVNTAYMSVHLVRIKHDDDTFIGINGRVILNKVHELKDIYFHGSEALRAIEKAEEEEKSERTIR